MTTLKISNPASNLLKQISLRLIGLTLTTGFILRIVMICTVGISALDMTFMQYCGAFFFGAVNDLAVAIISLVALYLFVLSIGNFKYRPTVAYTIMALLAAGTIYLTWFCPTLQDFNKGLSKASRWIMLYWTLCFAARYFLPSIRSAWTRIWLTAILFLYVCATLLNGVSEYFFWNEFAVRYNFIAVDYLVYTSEVIGNIMESYPIIPLAAVLLAISAATTWLLFRKQIADSDCLYHSAWKLPTSAIYIALAALSAGALHLLAHMQQSENVYYNELQANGPDRFVDAFMKNRIDYKQFYSTLPEPEATDIVHDLYDSTANNFRHIPSDSAECHANIVLITMESMSASFMERFGNPERLTPVLDSLYRHSIAFDRMFANGNRTVRGLEALSLSLPPSAGQSLIKRPDLKPRTGIGSVLRDKGYRTIFFYGGKSYFDNMGPFFRSIGFDVVDIDNYSEADLTFKNVWGVCDEDSYTKMLHTLDDIHDSGSPFFAQLMTISNHRPYTYPEGRIDISATSKSRRGGIMYSDYALGRFMHEASKKPWFDNTVFVIVADHCASSAGETELPLENYHIPALIYQPSKLQPEIIGHTVSQIDLMPTVLAILGIGYDSTFYGRNALSADFTPRAFLATYQDLGYLEGDILTVLSPVKRVRQYRIDPTAENPLATVRLSEPDSVTAAHATAIYQTSALWND